MLKKGMYSYYKIQFSASFQIKTFSKIYYKQRLLVGGFQIYMWISTIKILSDVGRTPLGFTSCIPEYVSDFPLTFVDQHEFCFFSCDNFTVIKSINLAFRVEVHKQATSVACSEH